MQRYANYRPKQQKKKIRRKEQTEGTLMTSPITSLSTEFKQMHFRWDAESTRRFWGSAATAHRAATSKLFWDSFTSMQAPRSPQTSSRGHSNQQNNRNYEVNQIAKTKAGWWRRGKNRRQVLFWPKRPSAGYGRSLLLCKICYQWGNLKKKKKKIRQRVKITGESCKRPLCSNRWR